MRLDLLLRKICFKRFGFFDTSLKSKRQIKSVINELGLINEPVNSRHFVHPQASLSIEFPSAPLTIGDEFIPASAANTLTTSLGTLRLLTPTDCVKDRLANYYYFGDSQCLSQALMVAKAHPINMKSLELWHKNEKQESGFFDFVSRLSKT